MNWFKPLNEKDIEEKIKLNEKKGLDVQELRNRLEQELFAHERDILRVKFNYTNENIIINKDNWKGYLKEMLPLEIQAQNLREQISYINRRELCQRVTQPA